MSRQTRSDQKSERNLPTNGDFIFLTHVQISGFLATWKRPVKCVYETCKCKLYHTEPQIITRAHSSPCPKRYYSKIPSIQIHRVLHKAIRIKLQRLLPRFRISRYAPHIHHHIRIGRNVMPHDSLDDSGDPCGIISGVGGCRRRVSVTTACRYLR